MKGITKKYQNSGWPFRHGHIIIPPLEGESTRSSFVNTCYRKKKVSLLLDGGGVAHNCPIPKYLLREIEFPAEFGQVGSAVFAYIHPFYNTPMVVALYGKEDDVDLSEEYEKRIQSINQENIAEIAVGGKNGTINLSVDSNQEDGGIININVSNRSRTGKLKLNILGDSEIYVSGKCELYSNSEVDLRVEDLEGEEVSSINVKGAEITFNDNILDSFMADINALTERYNLIEEDINTLKEAFLNWAPITTDGGAALKTITTDWFSVDLDETEVNDIKDEKIKN